MLDIKKRGTSVTPEELRKQLLPGGKPGKKSKKTATLVLTRIGEDRVAISVEPVWQPAASAPTACRRRGFPQPTGPA